MSQKLIENVKKAIEAVADEPARIAFIQAIRQVLFDLSPLREEPVDCVRWVPIDKVESNSYNPNSVARIEMRLLYTSIFHDHLTQPVVVIYDAARGVWVVVDGFHRYYICKTNPDILARTRGMLPVVVLDKSLAERMASTVRHNRARGKHSTQGMANLVFSMLEEGWSDQDIQEQIGLSAEELLRLKHVTGFSKLFENVEYRKAWMTHQQIRIQNEYRESHEQAK
jgi:ParB-like chromosome segregation protein Spo0J